MSHLPGKFVWREHISPDIRTARAFYEALFHWHLEALPDQPGRALLFNGERPIGGVVQAPFGTPAQWVSYLSVDDVEQAMQRATSAGATVAEPPQARGHWGRGARLVDPTGAVVHLWRATASDPPDTSGLPMGDFCWTELHTPDPDTACAFYERVAGHAVETMDMGPLGRYRLLKAGGQMRAGVQPVMPGQPALPTQWLPYVQVVDCDRCAAQAQRLGGHGVVSPMDIPGVGRSAVLCDPQGALFAILSPAMAA